LAELGGICWKHAVAVILLWLAATVAAGFLATGLTDRLQSGTGDIKGSMSLKVDQSLQSDFGRSDSQLLVVAFRSASIDRNPAELSALFDALTRGLAARDSVETAIGERDIHDDRLLPKAGTGHVVIIGLKSGDLLTTEQEVPKVRAAVAPIMEKAKSRHSDLQWAVTGRAALTYDLSRFDTEDTARAEIRALPLTLIILAFAFGSVVSSMLPLVLAVASRTIVLGIVFLLAGTVETSNLVQSVVAMLSLALGIDYSLFIIHRYRRELDRCRAEDPNANSRANEEAAMRSAMAQSGAAVLYSAATVAIGIGSLLATPIMQTRSVGLGGLFAVLITLAASLTLVPAFLRLVRPSVLEWPEFLSRRTKDDRSRKLWSRWAHVVAKKPTVAVVASLAVIVALAAPAIHTRTGFPESEFLPSELEFSRGMNMLREMGLRGLVSPVVVVLSDSRREKALTPERAPSLSDFVTRLEQDHRVRAVQGPVRSEAASSATTGASIDEAVGGAMARTTFISHDGTRLLFLIVPSGDSTLLELRKLSKEIPSWLKADGYKIRVGGQAQYYNDYDEAVLKSYPATIGLVLGMSALVLLLFFRAPVASAKAILLNLLSVAAGYGAVVLVFQLGYGSELFGVYEATNFVPTTVPLAIFCILFGLSMDYEIFLLSRIRTIFSETGDNARSIGEALADTGSVITSAALIMVAVFGAFAFARDVLVQMIGLGLAVAVLVDAVLIRSVLGPAIMQIAGRWNWWPGGPAIRH